MVWNLMDTTERVRSHFMNNYLRHWTYKDYPVVGVSPQQIERYAMWKTDRINEMILIREGVLDENRSIKDSTDIFSTTTYFGNLDPLELNVQGLDPNNASREKGERRIRIEDGILLPRLRLLSERE